MEWWDTSGVICEILLFHGSSSVLTRLIVTKFSFSAPAPDVTFPELIRRQFFIPPKVEPHHAHRASNCLDRTNCERYPRTSRASGVRDGQWQRHPGAEKSLRKAAPLSLSKGTSISRPKPSKRK